VKKATGVHILELGFLYNHPEIRVKEPKEKFYISSSQRAKYSLFGSFSALYFSGKIQYGGSWMIYLLNI
jgi:hypothetical protein